MKRVPVFIFTFILLAASKGYAQGFHLGIKGGANISKIDGRSFDEGFKFGYSFGAYAELNFSKKWGIQPELILDQTRSHTGEQFSDIYAGIGISDIDVNVNYLNIPILLSFRPIPLLSIQLGPQFGAKLYESDIKAGASDAFKDGDVSIIGGVQFNLARLKLGARYFSSLTNNDNVGDSDTWKNKGFQLYVGFNLF
jgi:Outer membrane protein beta-barrel domain